MSCRGPLPSDADFERAYKQSQKLAQQDISELEARRARGEISAAEYVQMKRDIMDRITARANEMVLTQTALVQSSRQAKGLPTPETPQDITVPQAGSLSTGTARRSFNDSGNADGTGSGLGFLPGGTIGAGFEAGFNGIAAAPVTAVAIAPVAPVAAPVVAAPTGVTASRPAPSAGAGAGASAPAGGGRGGR